MDAFGLADARAGDTHEFVLGEHLDSVWGGLHGGAVAGALLVAARTAAPGRTPVSLDVRFLRGTAPGAARVTSRVLNHGRTLTSVAVELEDSSERLTAAGLATFAEPAQLRCDLRAEEPRALRWGSPLPEATGMTDAPGIVQLLGVRLTYRCEDGWLATPIATPWADTAATGPELSCLVADLVQGVAAYHAVDGQNVATPNPDLALRFTSASPAGDVVGEARSLHVGGGSVIIESRVRSGERVLAQGVSACVLMPMGDEETTSEPGPDPRPARGRTGR